MALALMFGTCLLVSVFADTLQPDLESLPESNFDELLVRLESLKQKTETRLKEIEETNKTVQALVASLENFQGEGCKEGYFQCGNDLPQCIPNLQVCDRSVNCKNGADEKPALCVRPLPVGSRWKGPVADSRCTIQSTPCVRQLTIGIVQVRTTPWFPSKADVAVKWTSSAEVINCGLNTTTVLRGDYNYGLQMMTLTGDTGDLGYFSVTCELQGLLKHPQLRCRMPLNRVVLCEEVVLQRV